MEETSRPAAAALRRPRPLKGVHPGRRTLVVIPAKDEAANLPSLLTEVARFHPLGEVLVVDDGSRDETSRIAGRLGCRVLRHCFNLGYGSTLLTGYHYALQHDYRYLVQIDGDGQHPPAAIEALLAPLIAGEADVVIGSRYLNGGNPETGRLRRLGALPLAWIASLWTGTRITDPTSGMQALRREAVLELCSDGFPDDFPDIDVLIHLHRKGFRLREIPVSMRPRRHGRSMHGGLRALYYFFRMAVCLLLLPVRRSSPYRRQRLSAAGS